jgi:hypothetical protein
MTMRGGTRVQPRLVYPPTRGHRSHARVTQCRLGNPDSSWNCMPDYSTGTYTRTAAAWQSTLSTKFIGSGLTWC